MKFKKIRKGKNFFFIFLVICLLSGTNTYSQNEGKKITGRVVDERGELMIGVTVTEVDSHPINGVITDVNGNYQIHVRSSSSSLKFSFVGYKDYDIKVGNLNVIDVTMQESITELEEVVAVAFGTQKKKDLIGSVTSIRPADLRVPSSNLTTVLAGQAAGIISYQRTGEPGEDNANSILFGTVKS